MQIGFVRRAYSALQSICEKGFCGLHIERPNIVSLIHFIDTFFSMMSTHRVLQDWCQLVTEKYNTNPSSKLLVIKDRDFSLIFFFKTNKDKKTQLLQHHGSLGCMKSSAIINLAL